MSLARISNLGLSTAPTINNDVSRSTERISASDIAAEKTSSATIKSEVEPNSSPAVSMIAPKYASQFAPIEMDPKKFEDSEELRWSKSFGDQAFVTPQVLWENNNSSNKNNQISTVLQRGRELRKKIFSSDAPQIASRGAPLMNTESFSAEDIGVLGREAYAQINDNITELISYWLQNAHQKISNYYENREMKRIDDAIEVALPIPTMLSSPMSPEGIFTSKEINDHAIFVKSVIQKRADVSFTYKNELVNLNNNRRIHFDKTQRSKLVKGIIALPIAFAMSVALGLITMALWPAVLATAGIFLATSMLSFLVMHSGAHVGFERLGDQLISEMERSQGATRFGPASPELIESKIIHLQS